MKTSQLLKLAKDHLAKNHCEYSTKTKFICISIALAGKAEDRLIGLVQDRLGGEYTLDGWLAVNHGVKYANASKPRKYAAHNNKMQATRHAWVDSMIAEFAANGD